MPMHKENAEYYIVHHALLKITLKKYEIASHSLGSLITLKDLSFEEYKVECGLAE